MSDDTRAEGARYFKVASYWTQRAIHDRMGGLDLTNHELTYLPPGIGDARDLTTLTLDRNKLNSLPEEIGNLTKLSYLSVRNNPLTHIPREIGNLPDTTARLLDTHLLPRTLAAAYAAGIPSFLAYLRSLSEAEPHYEGKVVFIGDGNAGKTTCLERLITGTFVERPTTHGIEVQSLTIPHPDDNVRESILLNCWDFGGQDIYRITHQFFYSRDAIYILVWNPRDKARRQGLEVWLEGIKLRLGSMARVLIVSTHADEDQRAYRVDYEGLRQDYSDIIAGSLEIDSFTGRGFERLRHAIAEVAVQLPHVGDQINTKWLSLKEDLLRRKPQISFDDYSRIRASRRIMADQEESALAWLSAIGSVLYFPGDFYLRSFIVTEPEWLTKAIGYLVSDRKTLEMRGELPHEELFRLWLHASRDDYGGYRRAHLPYLLRLTERFDITYVVPDRENLSLVAELVPESPPADLPWRLIGAGQFEGRELSLICQFPLPLPGLMARLIVRTHRFTTGRHWVRGVFLAHEVQRSTALIEMVRPTELHLTVRSSDSPISFFEVIREIIASVVQDHYEEIAPDFLIPCRGRDGAKPCRGTFHVFNVEKARLKPATEMQCQSCLSNQDVNQLLTGFQTSHDNVLDAIRRIEAKISVPADQAYLMRDVLRQVAEIHEQVDCPRLFLLEPIDQKAWNPRHWLEHAYKLTLYCEHPEHEHPWLDATYTLNSSQEWLKKVSPYIGYVGKAIKYGVPVLGSGVGLFLGDGAALASRDEIEFSSKIAGLSPAKIDTKDTYVPSPPSGGERLQGAAFFEFRHMLLQLTAHKTPKFGGLRRVRDASGRYLWVCPEHDIEFYNPPLSTIPDL